MVKFAFRQRVGKINWNIVSAVSIKDVIKHLQLNELQSVLDAITFCEFGSSDVKHCPIDTIVQLIHIFQFIVEFLLYSQENQNILIEKLSKKEISLKDSNRQLSAQVASLKEDTKIYKRQLSVLRHSIGIRQPENPKVVDLSTKNKTSLEIQPIIASVLQNEKESRDLIRVLLEDQRNAFMKELELNRKAYSDPVDPKTYPQKDLHGILSDKESSNHSVDSIEKIMNQMKDMLNQQQEQQRSTVASDSMTAAINKEENFKTQRSKEELDTLKKQLIQKEKDLLEREENLKFDIRDYKNLKKAEKEKEKAKIYLSSVNSLASLKPPTEEKTVVLREKSRAVSAMTIRARLMQGKA